VVNEALACGRPVIVSDAVGCGPDLVGPENGWTTHLDDHILLTGALLQAFDQRDQWDQMGAAGRKKVSKNTFSEMACGVASALQFIRRSDVTAGRFPAHSEIDRKKG
jgi:glycosyltransferase involved in cell wall biosynthesis